MFKMHRCEEDRYFRRGRAVRNGRRQGAGEQGREEILYRMHCGGAALQANAEDIYAEAQQINEERAAEEQVIGDDEQADGAETAEEPAETSGE